MRISFKGAPKKLTAVIQGRATALLEGMEREFSGLTVEVSDGKSTDKAEVAKAGKDSKLAGPARFGPAGRSERR